MRDARLTLEVWDAHATPSETDIDMLADVLHAVVQTGAGVSFIVPFSVEDARAFFTGKVLPSVRAGSSQLLVARLDGRIVGTVQLEFPWPPNQPHRGEVAKLLVHPDARRRGIARELMLALEGVAREANRSLLTLDTWTEGPAQRLYESLGYVIVGVIPGFARGSTTEKLEPTTIMYKQLG
jgi:ribosomal protein S18 acetylase RimI-like enzyme